MGKMIERYEPIKTNVGDGKFVYLVGIREGKFTWKPFIEASANQTQPTPIPKASPATILT
jgi:hypothetical protein